MSGDIRTGRKARKILTIMAAVFAVAMMLAVPLVVAVDSEAKFTAGDAGVCVTATNASDEELTDHGLGTKSSILTGNGGTTMFLKIFDISTLGYDAAVDAESLTVKSYDGMKVEEYRKEYYDGYEVTAEKVKFEFTAKAAGNLLRVVSYGEDYDAAVAAIKAHLGDEVSVGDKITITGDIKMRGALKDIREYADVDGTESVTKSHTQINYILLGTDVTISFTHGGETKIITFYSDQKFEVDRDADYDYKGKEYKDLKEGDKCNITYMDTYYFESGSTYYKVDGKEYKIENRLTPAFPEEDADVLFYKDSAIQYELNLLKTAIGLIAGASANVTVDKTFAASESAFSDLAGAVALDDILAVILLIVGVVIGIIVLIVILIIVVIIVKKKKK